MIIYDSYEIVEYDIEFFAKLGFSDQITNLRDVLDKKTDPIIGHLFDIGYEFILHLRNSNDKLVKLLVSIQRDGPLIILHLNQIQILSSDRNITEIYDDINSIILDNISEYVVILDKDRKILSMNKYPVGYSPEDIINMDAIEFVHKDSKADFDHYFAATIEKNQKHVFDYYTLPKRVYVGQLIPYYSKKDNSLRILFLSFEITELKDTQKELQNTLNMYNNLLEYSPIGITISSDGKISYCNPKFAEILEREPEEVLELESHEIIAPSFVEEIKKRAELRLKGEDVPGIYEIDLVTKSGEIRRAIHEIRIAQWKGKPVALSYIRDVTEQKKLEKERELILQKVFQSNRLESLGTMASGMAHEINNYLVGILGNASILQQKIDDEERRQIVDQIITSSEDTREIVRQVLNISGKEKVEKSLIELNQSIMEMEDMIKSMNMTDIIINYQLYHSKLIVRANLIQLKQIIINLVKNAIEASTKQKPVIIKTDVYSLTKEETIQPYCFGNIGLVGDFAGIEIRDFGTGIPPDQIKYIFDPFYSSKSDGRGLGLAVVLGIVKSNNGLIMINSSEEGTKFTVYFPLAKDDLTGTETTTSQFKQITINKVLVVEDNLEVLSISSKMFDTLGVDVIKSNNRTEALSIVEKYNDIDIIFSDISMPGNMDIHSFVNQVKRLDETIQIIFTSGYSSNVVSKYLQDEEYQFLPKPFTLQELHDVLTTLK